MVASSVIMTKPQALLSAAHSSSLTLGYGDPGGWPEARSCLTDGLTVPPPGDPDRFAPWLGCQTLVFPLLKEIANSTPF